MKVISPIIALLLLDGVNDSDLSTSAVHPENGANNVALDTVITVANNNRYLLASLPDQSLTLKSASGHISAQLIETDRYIALIPDQFLSPNTQYTIEYPENLSTIINGLPDRPSVFTTGSHSQVGDDLAMFRLFKQRTLEWAAQHHNFRQEREARLKEVYSEINFGTGYYDATYGYHQAAEFLGLSGTSEMVFREYAHLASDIYRTNVSSSVPTPTNPYTAMTGRRVFPAGLLKDIEANLEADNAKQTLIDLRNHSEMRRLDNPRSFIGLRFERERYARPLSYYLEALIYHERAGLLESVEATEVTINKINLAKDALLDHLRAYTSHQYHPNGHGDGYTFKFTQPFMTGLVADALIDYLDWLSERRPHLLTTTGLQTHNEALSEIGPVIEDLGDWLFEANNWVVSIPADNLNVDDVLTFSSNIATFANGPTQRTRPVIAVDLTAGVIKQAMPFNLNDAPTITVTGPNGVIAHSIEEKVTMWIPEVGGTPGAWNDQGGSGLGGAFRYVVPTTSGLNGTNGVGSTNPATDLNMLMLPIVGFLYQQSCDDKWKARGDAMFEGGVLKAAWQRTKQYNQQFKNTFSYIQQRQTACP